DQCYIVSARQAAMGAKIVVVNHHLLLADLLLKEEGFGELLPGADAVIIDEAHQFPEIAQGFFNVSFSSRSLVDLSRDLKTEAFSQIAFSKKLLPAAEKLNKLAQDVRLSLPNIGNNLLWSDIPKAFSKKLKSLILHLDFLIDQLQAVDESNLGLRSCYERICVLAERIEQIVSASDVDGLRWLGLTKRGFSLNFTPVDTSTELGSLLSNQICSWVFTSATLAVGDDFSHYQSRLGLKEINKLKIPSPFDYQDSGLLILPNDLPEPSEDIYTKRMLDKLLPLIMASKGRAFLLFTSYRALNQASKIIKKSKSWSFPLLVQGDSSRSKLLEQFIALSNPILLGTASFWEGVDIRGDGLVVVCIDRLPFTSPGDPMLKARLDAIARDGGQPFIDFQLPQAILALKQGVGRLIRDNKDYGVVVICDPRLTSKSYGRKFLQSLPPFPISNNIYDAVDFFYNKGSMDA
ncbi:MAG: ATP-dependent DNA helicase, partial [Pseudomonadota bacterium]|nr:ATP-dependent DNA helicase [Pseudomonadota bacterium]